MDKLQQMIGDYRSFLNQLLREVNEAEFDLADFVQLDHLCYRAPSAEHYTAKKEELATVGQLLSEAQINGRPISTFRLHSPFFHQTWRIDAVELAAPRKGFSAQEGLEHVEFVLFDSFEYFMKKYPDKTFDLTAIDRGVNPHIAFALPSCSVKFHLLSLSTAVYLQQKLGLTNIRDRK